MAKFDWGQLQEEKPATKSAAKFDWSQLQEEGKKPVPSDPAGAAQAGLEHFGNAASLGYLPQIQALASQLTPDPNKDLDAKLKAEGFDIQQPKQTYVSDRDANIKRLEQQAQDHPYASTAGTVAGALTTGIATSAAAPINAASRMGRIAQAAKGGAILGAVSNPGDKEGEVADGLQIGDRVRNAATGAGLGALGQGAIEGVSAAAKGVMNLPKSLRAKAEERAFKSSGAMLRDYRKAAGRDRINELGRLMLDEGLVKPGMTVDDVAEAALKLKGDKGEALGKILKELGSVEDDIGGQVARRELADSLTQHLIQDGSDLPSVAKNNKYFKILINTFKKRGDKELSIGALQKMKETAQKQINWDRLPGADIPLEEQFNRAVYSAAKDALETRAETLASAVGRKDYTTLKKAYGGASEIAKISKDQVLRQNANRFFSPSDYLTAGTGAIAGAATGDDMESKIKNAAIGASLGLVNKAARRYGTPLVSIGMDKAGSLLSKTPLSAAGEIASPALSWIERSPVSVVNAARKLSTPQFEHAVESIPIPKVADEKPKGEDRWAQNGLEKLGIKDRGLASELMQSKEGKRLLIEASDLPPGSPRLKQINERLKKGRR